MTGEGILLSSGFLLAIFLGLILGVRHNFTLEVQHIQRRRLNILWNVVENTTRAHRDSLLNLVHQLRTTDAQGKADYSEAHKYIYQFIETVIMRDLQAAGVNPVQFRSNPAERDKIFVRVCDMLSDYAEKQRPAAIEGIESGEDFERMCGLVLKDRGWEVAISPRIGALGSDLIAMKSDVKVVVQCRFLSPALGEDAVQDAMHAKERHEAPFAAIVSTAVFSHEARRLAAENNVLLVHHEDLAELENGVMLVA